MTSIEIENLIKTEKAIIEGLELLLEEVKMKEDQTKYE